MHIVAKQGDILTTPTVLEDTKFLVGYAKEGGSPLFAVMEHAGAVSLVTSEDKEFKDILNLIGI